MKRSNIFSILFASAIMLIISLLCYGDILNLPQLSLKGLIIFSLIAIFPITFLIQGIICAITNTNILTSLPLSLMTYLVIMFVYLNTSALAYAIIYVACYIIGYLPTKLIIKFKTSRVN